MLDGVEKVERFVKFLVNSIQCIAGEYGVSDGVEKVEEHFCENFWSRAFSV